MKCLLSYNRMCTYNNIFLEIGDVFKAYCILVVSFIPYFLKNLNL